MAVEVLTKDHGKILHKEAATAKWDELGFLSLFSDETDASSGIAGYAAGTWVSAVKVELTEEAGKAKPRVWHRWADVPSNTRVEDRIGRAWVRWDSDELPHRDHEGPFTEVIA
ncbi:hypothetical protein THIBAULT_125 [Mycobacterium phage Thibault]|uniref:Uncharacterized protein n=1 Tax=Mycobacterium phage Thibault TaxID=1052673 RepID=G1FGJ0_9CAUD|nr:hypothetical protein CL87_gp125 [Mycobacterium phage Thibault]AEJ94048.1 hypothetical protein THIBAULT_125 [Mycobacterium phage Thibault]